jgi:hypothetical protein
VEDEQVLATSSEECAIQSAMAVHDNEEDGWTMVTDGCGDSPIFLG